MFYEQLGVACTNELRLAVMDRWRAFRKGTEAHAPQAAILSDTFHVLRQLNDAFVCVLTASLVTVAGCERPAAERSPTSDS